VCVKVVHLIRAPKLPEMECMGALARFRNSFEPAQPAPRAKALGMTLMRPTRRVSGTRSIITALPQEVLLLDEGIAVATYADDGAVQYSSLDALLDDHGLDAGDLEVVDRVPGVGRWHR
jgi:hypothetical protein